VLLCCVSTIYRGLFVDGMLYAVNINGRRPIASPQLRFSLFRRHNHCSCTTTLLSNVFTPRQIIVRNVSEI